MPELPEVETIKCALEPHIINQTVKKVETHTHTLRNPLDAGELNDLIAGCTFKTIRRFGKFLIIDFGKDTGLLVHLGMTGAFSITDSGLPPEKHERVTFHMANGQALRYSDIRKFGIIKPCILPEDRESAPADLAHLGVEPLAESFNSKYLFKISRKRKMPIKNFIMNQTIVTGVGNIYACEALFMSRIHPQKEAGKLTQKNCDALTDNIKKVLLKSIEAGGTTISDYRSVNGEEGKFVLNLKVYGKRDLPCPECDTTIERITLGGRSTFYCPKCQKK